MIRSVLALLLSLIASPLYAPPCEVQVKPAPMIPEPCELGELPPRTVFRDPMGRWFLVVTPATAPAVWGTPHHWLHGVERQPPSSAIVVPYYIPGYGAFTLRFPGPVYCVDLEDGTLCLMKRDTWARPATSSRLAVVAGERLE